MKPSIGRIVHYVSHGTPPGPDGSQAYTSECRAAIVTEVIDPSTAPAGQDAADGTLVGLAVLNPAGMFFNRAWQDEPGHAGGTWHWPERAE